MSQQHQPRLVAYYQLLACNNQNFSKAVPSLELPDLATATTEPAIGVAH